MTVLIFSYFMGILILETETDTAMKRFFCLFIAVMLLCLPACSKKQTNTTKKTEEKVTLTEIGVVTTDTDSMKKKAVEALNSLSDTELSQKGITVFSATDMTIVPQDENTIYSYNISQRNRMFEKKYSTKLYQFTEDSDTLLTEAYYNMLSGIGFADLLSIPAKDLHKYAAKGVLLNTSALPQSDFSADWFDSALMEKAAHGNEKYAIYGDLNKDISSYYCVYLNKTLLSEAGMEMPFKDVANGNWTWDTLLESARNFSSVNQGYTLSATSEQEIANVCFKSAGYDYINAGYKKTPSVSFANAPAQELLETLRSLYTTNLSYTDTDFIGGNSLYYIGTVGEMDNVKFTKDDWCVLPLPKANAQQENYMAYMDENHTVITCFAGANDASKLFYAVEGLYAASYGGYITQAYYNDLVLNSLRDSDTLNMLDYICGVKSGVQTTDFTDYYYSAYPELYTKTRDALTEAAKGNTVHIYDLEEKTKASLDPLLEKNF